MAQPRRLELDPVRLKAMAHPLRVEILYVLQQRDRASVTSLAEELGETTGAISYHLRQLARHGFVKQWDPGSDDSPATPGRPQQWWQMAVDEIHSTGFGMLADTATSEAARFLLNESVTRSARDLAHWYSTATEWPLEWQRAHTAMNGHLELNATQTRALADELSALMLKYQQSQPGPGARTVSVHYALFPTETGDRR